MLKKGGSGQFQGQSLEHKYLGFSVGEKAETRSQAVTFLLSPLSGPLNLS